MAWSFDGKVWWRSMRNAQSIKNEIKL